MIDVVGEGMDSLLDDAADENTQYHNGTHVLPHIHPNHVRKFARNDFHIISESNK